MDIFSYYPLLLEIECNDSVGLLFPEIDATPGVNFKKLADAGITTNSTAKRLQNS